MTIDVPLKAALVAKAQVENRSLSNLVETALFSLVGGTIHGTETIQWTPKMLTRLKVAYKKAMDGGAESFVFEDRQYLVAYAGYLIQYLDGHFKRLK